MGKIHTLKTWPEFFKAVVEGRKRCELRVNDRDFQVGDCLVLQEFEPTQQVYTREMFSVRVTYLSTMFLPDGLVVMSIEPFVADVLAASPTPPEPKADVLDSLHTILTSYGIASRTDPRLAVELVRWAADMCRQSARPTPPQEPAK